MMNSKWILGLTFVGIVGATFATAQPAKACGDGLWEPPSAEQTTVDEAERLLEEGEQAKAGELISGRFWYVRGALPHKDTVYVIQRAIRVLALSSARADGNVRVGTPYSNA